MSDLLFKKAVDQSVLKAGMTLPREIHAKVLKEIGSPVLNKGDKIAIKVKIDESVFEANLTKVNFSEAVTNREVLQIRYAEGSPLCRKLNEIFLHSAQIISEANVGGTERISIPEDDRESIDVYTVGPGMIEFRCFPKIKTAFLEYLGSETDLSGYQRSYKLVFFKCFFERYEENKEISANVISQAFREYYVQRKQNGFAPDVNVDSVIEHIESSSPESVYGLILKNPFSAISRNGYIEKVTRGGTEYFKLPDRLANSLTSKDVSGILNIVDKKLVLYFQRIDSVVMEGSKLKSVFDKILNSYIAAKQEFFAGHPLGNYFRNDIPEIFYSSGLVDPATHLVTGSVGQGNWATVPWICIFDRKITTSATKGVYIVYLLAKDGQTLYLTFNQGCTDIRQAHSKKETIQIMRDKAKEITSRIDSRGFSSDGNINLGVDLTELAELYQKGTIFYKSYTKGALPSEAVLRKDLANMLEIYAEYANEVLLSDNSWWPPSEEYSSGISKEKWLELLNASDVFTESALKMMAEFCVYGREATCTQLSEYYGKPANYYLSTSIHLAKRVVEKTNCPIVIQNEENKWWPILYVGKAAEKGADETFIWKIRPELYEALIEFDIKRYLHTGGEEELSIKETIERIKEYISAKGFSYEDGMIENFYLSLRSKPFVILAGTSGTGKTRLVKLFAEAVGATNDNGRYEMISVRPDWSDSTDLFGHTDLNGRFIPGAILDFVKKAELDSTKPYFLCLDEMNLARVEYYLSDILSVIETRDFVTGGKIDSAPLVPVTYYGTDNDAAGKYGTVKLPENLYIIGTVNMDETTFPFSRKVLDRANTIEFSYVDLLPNFSEVQEKLPEPINVPNVFLKSKYLLLNQCSNDAEIVGEYCAELQQINRILQMANAHVGYRVRDEIVFYLLNNRENSLIPENMAMDNEIMQKILPRIQGSSISVKNMLCELFKHCAGDYEGYQTQSDDIGSKMLKAVENPNCKYKHSAKKIAFMVRRYEEDGFTSYWL